MFKQLIKNLDAPHRIGDAAHPAPGRAMQKAAVLVLLSEGAQPGEAELLLTERAAHLRKHAGQISFPGGSRDGAETPEQTALREAYEECEIDPQVVTVLGHLPASALPVTDFAITPVVGTWPGVGRAHVAPSPDEVAAIYSIKVADLANPANRGVWRRDPDISGPAFEIGELVIWGFTALIIDGLLELGGWAQPWNRSRQIVIPPRFDD